MYDNPTTGQTVADESHLGTWREQKYRVDLWSWHPRAGRERIAYTLRFGDELIFSGDDFGPSPMLAVDSDESAGALLAFLSLKPGDTEAEYFADYSPRQLEFVGEHGELLALWSEELEKGIVRARAAARELGEVAAANAASWIVDGNSDAAAAGRVLKMLRDGDPAADDYLPRRPDLSGEMADDPTPQSLLADLLPDVPDSEAGDLAQVLADEWEFGAEDFGEYCERELIRFAGGEPCAHCGSDETRFDSHNREGEVWRCDACEQYFQIL